MGEKKNDFFEVGDLVEECSAFTRDRRLRLQGVVVATGIFHGTSVASVMIFGVPFRGMVDTGKPVPLYFHELKKIG